MNQLQQTQPHNYYPQQPVVDINNLADGEEIRMEYDALGNLSRVYKQRRNSGCFSVLFIIGGTIALMLMRSYFMTD